MSYSSYITLKTLTDSFRGAVTSTSGLNEHHQLYESEINSIKDYNYPICVTEIPNSSIENVNRAKETFEVTCFILKQNTDNVVVTSSLYDDCLGLFDSWLSNLMIQRDGNYILENDSIQIDRLQKFGADSCYGCKVTFNLVVPSVLIGSSQSVVLNMTNSLARFNPKLNVTINQGSLTWVSPQGLVITESTLSNDTFQPSYSTVSDSWIFQDKTGTFGNAESLKLNDVSMPTTSWSIFMLVKTEPINEHMTLFSTLNAAGSSHVRVEILSNTSNFPSQIKVATETSEVINSGDLNVSELLSKEFTPIGLVNDGSNEKFYIYIGNEDRLELDLYDDNQWNNRDLYFAGAGISSFAINITMNPFVGELKDIIIYTEAVDNDKAKSINQFLYQQNG